MIGIALVSAAFRAAITLIAIGDFGGARGGDLFLGRNRQRTRGFGDGLGFGLLLALGGDDDGGLLGDDLDVALHFGGAALRGQVGLFLSALQDRARYHFRDG